MRSLVNTSAAAVEVLVVVSGDHQKRPRFRSDVIEAAYASGQARDAQGYVARAHLIPSYGLVAE